MSAQIRHFATSLKHVPKRTIIGITSRNFSFLNNKRYFLNNFQQCTPLRTFTTNTEDLKAMIDERCPPTMNVDDDGWADLQNEAAQSYVEDFSLDYGETVYETRSSTNLTYKVRVIKHSNKIAKAKNVDFTFPKKETILDQLNNFQKKQNPDSSYNIPVNEEDIPERILYEFQTAYDGGDDYNDAELATTKSLIQVEPRTSEVYDPATCSMMSAITFFQNPPRNALLIGSWGGSIANYLSTFTNTNVHIIDQDLVSREAAREFAGFNPEENNDLPTHAFDLAVEKADFQEIADAINQSVELNNLDGVGKITISDKFTDPESYISYHFSHSDPKHHTTAVNIMKDRAHAINLEKAHEERKKVLLSELERARAELKAANPNSTDTLPDLPEDVMNFSYTSPYAEEELYQYNNLVLEVHNSPVRSYDLIIQDSEANPNYSNIRHLQNIRNLLHAAGTHDGNRGIFVRRLTLAPENCSEIGPFAKVDYENVQEVADMIKSVFKNVYISQPTIDSFIFVAHDNTRFADGNKYPVNDVRLIDTAVALWEQKIMPLAVMERVDGFTEFKEGQQIEICDDPDQFI